MARHRSRSVCIEEDCLEPAEDRGRCLEHQREHDRQRGTKQERGYDATYYRLRPIVLNTHVRKHGWVCPGYGRPRHRSKRLTVDHITPRARGGTNTLDNLGVLCLSCNSRKRASTG